MAKILYAYPEPLPSQKARCVQVIGTCTALAKLLPITLVADIVGDIFSQFDLEKPEGMEIIDLKRRLGPFVSNKWFSFKLRQMVKRIRPDILWLRHPGLARDLAAKGLPVIYELHEIFSDKHPDRADLFRTEMDLCRMVKGIACINRNLKLRWQELYGNIPISIIPSGTFYDKNLKKELVPGSVDTIYYVGTTYYKWKGLNILLDALERLEGIKLILVGDILKEKLPDHIKNRVKCVGHLSNPEVRAMLKEAQITILPNSANTVISRLYTSPLKLLEYMAAKTAIVASDLPSIREIVTEDEVLFFEPDDPVSLTNAVDKLSKDAKLRHKLALAAWRKAERYSWEARAEKIKVFIKSLT
ncbi:MAG: glycosyltransferase family 4 protein [Deltaproteobacteria bacterium]|nr:glycosyltransferase family 4 protein [Deltaproteobacteria bacterium]